MLFMLKAYISKPNHISNKEFYGVWLKESEAALGAVKAGAIKAIWKVAGRPEVIAVLDVDSHDTIDHAVLELPIWKTGPCINRSPRASTVKATSRSTCGCSRPSASSTPSTSARDNRGC